MYFSAYYGIRCTLHEKRREALVHSFIKIDHVSYAISVILLPGPSFLVFQDHQTRATFLAGIVPYVLHVIHRPCRAVFVVVVVF